MWVLGCYGAVRYPWGRDINTLGQEVWGWKASAGLCGVVGPRGWGCGTGVKGMGCWGLEAGVVGREGAVGTVGLGPAHGMERVGGRLWDRGRPSSVGWSPVRRGYGLRVLRGRSKGDGNRGRCCLWGRGHEEEGLGAEPLGSAARGGEVRLLMSLGLGAGVPGGLSWALPVAADWCNWISAACRGPDLGVRVPAGAADPVGGFPRQGQPLGEFLGAGVQLGTPQGDLPGPARLF